ncbi:MAG TPA: DUF2971 domain-containing protein [Pyrinomonadaceae bacterium]|nr:DUF2971 domain-containing protein [Pyrinomonadaceae bacterium]
MTLFKYIRAERIDIIENLEIRFTQPDALNDPFELHPHFESLVAEADVLANLPETPVDLRPMVAQAYAMLPEAYRAMLPIDAAMQAVEAFMATDDAREATAQGLQIFLRSMRDGAAPIREAIYRAFNDNVGILSLSEIPDHELMWAHYADSHKGLVLCFDEQHAFFNRRRSENDEFYFVRKVRYSDSPALSMVSLDGDMLLVTKGTKWTYEKEWRMLVPLKDATRALIIGGDTVHLFAFPPDALKGIILGAHATAVTKASVQSLLNDPSELHHVHLSQAILDLDIRSVRVSWPDMG